MRSGYGVESVGFISLREGRRGLSVPHPERSECG